MNGEKKTMRDAFLEGIAAAMAKNKNIFVLSADFGSPALDAIRGKYPGRFINVGIAEQNLVNVATGLALEGFTVYAMGIATFMTMRAFEQIRIDLALQAQIKTLNVNLIGVGAGLSYDVSGPTHHCLEDISILRTLPNLVLFSPSDWTLAKSFVDYSIRVKKPKYLRFDGKPHTALCTGVDNTDIARGWRQLREGKDVCLVATGYMVSKALRIADVLKEEGYSIGVLDIFLLKPLNETEVLSLLDKYGAVITLEEAFINKGGFDSMIIGALNRHNRHIPVKSFGFGDNYVFDIGSRDRLHGLNKLSDSDIIEKIKEMSEALR